MDWIFTTTRKAHKTLTPEVFDKILKALAEVTVGLFPNVKTTQIGAQEFTATFSRNTADLIIWVIALKDPTVTQPTREEWHAAMVEKLESLQDSAVVAFMDECSVSLKAFILDGTSEEVLQPGLPGS